MQLAGSDLGEGEAMSGDRHDSGAVQSALLQEYPHFEAHMAEVGDELGRIVRWSYLTSVALWVVVLSVLAFATAFQGRVGF
jgi:hypothetical protein